MKITKRELKKIIKEEIEQIGNNKDILKVLDSIINKAKVMQIYLSKGEKIFRYDYYTIKTLLDKIGNNLDSIAYSEEEQDNMDNDL